jgi:hypothetical protein
VNENGAHAFSGYKRVTKNGEEYFCRREGVTGSRTKTTETCLTLAEITTLRETGQDFKSRVQGLPGSSQGLDANGGMTMNPF